MTTPNTVFKEFGTSLAVSYPLPEYPQDLIDSIVMPALRRSYDKARRDDWRLAKATMADFKMMVGPVVSVVEHVNGEPCVKEWVNEGYTGCEWCKQNVDTLVIGWTHQFGWYAAIEVEEEEVAVHPGG